MKNQPIKPIQVLWEHIPEENAAELFRQAVALILAELDLESTTRDFDKTDSSGHPEGDPVE